MEAPAIFPASMIQFHAQGVNQKVDARTAKGIACQFPV
jgi:hypothetical protein